jgi:hypothetical protein
MLGAQQGRDTFAAMLWRPALVLAVCCCVSCGSRGSNANKPGDSEDDALVGGEYETPQEREYAKLALRFARVLANDDFAEACALGSSHFRTDMNVDALEAAEMKSRDSFGKPTRVFNGPAVNVDPADLAGPKKRVPGESTLDASLRRMSASRAVGEIPDSVPLEIRKASVEVEIERDPRTIPDFEEKTGMKPEEVTPEDRIVSYLTVVIVEEQGTLGVAHYFHRWPDVWD